MKSRKLAFLEMVLRWMAIAILKKYHPKIVGITGSIGKTSTKEAVFSVLSEYYKVRKNEKNYNNEIGIPLTIIGAESGGKSAAKWTIVFFRWLFQLILPLPYPKILVLEMGVDRPGDMKYLLSFIKPLVGIVTNVSGSHLEFFKNIDHIAKEKSLLIKSLPENGLAVLNGGDERVLKMGEKIKSPIKACGFGDNVQVKATDLSFSRENLVLSGISFKLNYEGKIIPVRLPGIAAPYFVNSALLAIAVGVFFKINLIEIARALENFATPPGRMKLIEGIKGSFIIDDSYNSSPASASAAIDVLKEIKARRKIAVFGDMLELGSESASGHQEIIKKSFNAGVSALFAVGERMKSAIRMIDAENFSNTEIFYFSDPEAAGRELQKFVSAGDVILIKGSQGMRMEKVAEEIMADPLQAENLLCRQSEEWKKIPFTKPQG